MQIGQLNPAISNSLYENPEEIRNGLHHDFVGKQYLHAWHAQHLQTLLKSMSQCAKGDPALTEEDPAASSCPLKGQVVATAKNAHAILLIYFNFANLSYLLRGPLLTWNLCMAVAIGAQMNYATTMSNGDESWQARVCMPRVFQLTRACQTRKRVA